MPQLPLTLLNSVFAVCQLSQELFPDQTPSATRVSVSVGVMNLVGPWIGALPCCHGSGGLAAQAGLVLQNPCSVAAFSPEHIKLAICAHLTCRSDLGQGLVLLQ